MAINIKTFFDQDTATFTYIVSGKNTNKAVIMILFLIMTNTQERCTLLLLTKLLDTLSKTAYL